MRRTRNVFGDRLSAEGRGRKNGRSLPRGPGSFPLDIARRIDLQRAFRKLAPKATETLFLYRVVGLTLEEIGAAQGISKQAVQKAYNKALRQLHALMNGASEGRVVAGATLVERHTELELRERTLSVAASALAWEERRAGKIADRLGKIRVELEDAQREAKRQTKENELQLKNAIRRLAGLRARARVTEPEVVEAAA
jgi:phosphate uptake regulator